MTKSKLRFVPACTVQGEVRANVLKSHLESEGIPAVLQYESAGRVYGITVDGLGAVKIMVPEELVEQAKQVIKPVEDGEGCVPDSSDNSRG